MSYNINNSNLLYYYPFDKDLLDYKTGTGVSNVTSANVAINTSTTKLQKGAIYFPGVSEEFIQLPSTTFSTNGISFALWMNFPIIPSSGYTSVFEFGSGINNKNIILFFNGAQLYFTIYNPSSGTVQTNYYLNYTLSNTNWHHYCINISSAGVWSVYIDGVQISGINFTAYPATSALTTCLLAKTSFQTTNLNCYMNQFLVFNRVLTANEIQLISTYPWLISYSNSVSSTYVSPPTTGNYYLFGNFDNTYTVSNQVLTNQNYKIYCASSNGKNLISFQGTYPNNTIYYSTNYGQNWALSNGTGALAEFRQACSPKNFPDVFYAGSASGSASGNRLLRSADGGATWTNISASYGNISGVCVNDADTIFYVTNYNNAVYYSTSTGNTSFNYGTNAGTFTFTQITGSNLSYLYAHTVCSPDGLFLYGTASNNNRLFTYNFNNTSSFNVTLATNMGFTVIAENIAMSSDGTYLYATLYLSSNGSFMRSINGGSTFAITGTGVLPTNIAEAKPFCDPTGRYVQFVYSSSWYISSDYGLTFAAYSGSIPTVVASIPTVFNNNKFISLVQNTSTQYGPLTTPNYNASTTVTTNYPCFLQGTKILTMNPETDDEEYVPIENLRRGDLIKTSLNGYKAISYIGRAILNNPASDPDKKNRLYKFTKSNISGMREDLYITGEHCTLHSSISKELLSKTREHMGDIYVTENKFRIPACIDERAKSHKDDSSVTIWHFALEHNNEYFNYGVYANGLLVESCSIEHMVNRSNMQLL